MTTLRDETVPLDDGGSMRALLALPEIPGVKVYSGGTSQNMTMTNGATRTTVTRSWYLRVETAKVREMGLYRLQERIGVGGMGKGNLRQCRNENIVALCDVDSKYAAGVFRQYPKAFLFQQDDHHIRR